MTAAAPEPLRDIPPPKRVWDRKSRECWTQTVRVEDAKQWAAKADAARTALVGAEVHRALELADGGASTSARPRCRWVR